MFAYGQKIHPYIAFCKRLLIKKQDKFVRFHAMQSVIVFGTLTIVESIVIVIGLGIARLVPMNVITLPSVV